MSELKSGTCWKCGAKLTPLDYGRQDTCRQCGWDTKVCKNCEFYDPAYNNECRENQADRVVEKERSNFCDYFIPKSGAGAGGPSKDAIKSAAEALFRKK
ncbi:MAG: hypothetical protein ACXVBW_05395 [Bdellovibrionota bacterium]